MKEVRVSEKDILEIKWNFRNLVVEMAKKSNYFFMQVLTRANENITGDITCINSKSDII